MSFIKILCLAGTLALGVLVSEATYSAELRKPKQLVKTYQTTAQIKNSRSPEFKKFIKAAQAKRFKAIAASAKRTGWEECDEESCLPEWEEEAWWYGFFNDDWDDWIDAEVSISRLDLVSIHGCSVSVSTAWGSADMNCDDIGTNDDLFDIGFGEDEREMLEVAVRTSKDEHLGDIASKALERWSPPCVPAGVNSNAYVEGAIAECTAFVVGQMPLVGTLGARGIAAKHACDTTRAGLHQDVALGERSCPVARE